jgi:CDP-diacylglycerol--glycerol-3-phosphate 3-phosphatidyltransferase
MPSQFSFQMFVLGRLILNRSTLKIVQPCRSTLLRSIVLKQQASPLRSLKKHVLLLRSTSTSSSIPSNQEKTDRVWTVPNILTFIRIGTSPILGYFIVSHQYPAALTLFVLSGLTDLLDGWIARRYPSQASALGSFLDPFADKVLVGFVVISLAYVQLLPLWLLALILSRDVAIMCVAAYLRVKSVQPPRTLKKILDMKTATVQLYPTFVSKVCSARGLRASQLET